MRPWQESVQGGAAPGAPGDLPQQPDPAAAEGAPALIAAARSLWPGSHVELARRGPRSAEHYALMPNARHAQLLVPVRPTAAASSAVRRFSSASSGRDVATRLAAAGVNRVTLGAVLRDRVVVHPGPDRDALRDHLGRALGRPVDFAIGVGPSRVNRKPVLQVFDGRGRTVAFAKIGDSVQARLDVVAETAALHRLAGRHFETLQVPEVLHASTWNDMAVLVVSPLRGGTPLRTEVNRTPLEAMAELSTVFQGGPGPLGTLPWWQRRFDVAAGVADDEVRARLLRCLLTLGERHARTRVEVSAWHGDWTPWNMARRRSQVLLWDWERFETGVPSGFDAWHYRLQSATRSLGLDVAVVLSALQRAGGDHGRDALVADLYLVAIVTRYAALLDAERGADIAGATDVMLRALEVRTARTRPVLSRSAPVRDPRGR